MARSQVRILSFQISESAGLLSNFIFICCSVTVSQLVQLGGCDKLEISRHVKNQFEVSADDFSPEDYSHPHGADKPDSTLTLIAIGFIGAVSVTLLISLAIYIIFSFIMDFINICCRNPDPGGPDPERSPVHNGEGEEADTDADAEYKAVNHGFRGSSSIESDLSQAHQ